MGDEQLVHRGGKKEGAHSVDGAVAWEDGRKESIRKNAALGVVKMHSATEERGGRTVRWVV